VNVVNFFNVRLVNNDTCIASDPRIEKFAAGIDKWMLPGPKLRGEGNQQAVEHHHRLVALRT
jgi:hypothetical protein